MSDLTLSEIEAMTKEQVLAIEDEQIDNMLVADLKAALAILEIEPVGLKEDLVAQLDAAIDEAADPEKKDGEDDGDEAGEDDEDEDGEDDEDEEEEKKQLYPLSEQRRKDLKKLAKTCTIVQLNDGIIRRIDRPLEKGGRNAANIAFGAANIAFFWNDKFDKK